MPWKKVEAMEERLRFISRAIEGDEDFSELCEEFNISRKTGYKLLNRYNSEGPSGIAERSRRPKSNPKEVCGDVLCEIVSIRIAHPRWGGETIQTLLTRKFPMEKVPTGRTIDRILKRCGLVQARRKRRRGNAYFPEEVIRPKEPNEVWTVDFKGHWQTKDGKRCNPLTIRDEYSKYLLDLAALPDATTASVKRRFELCFEKYGLPRYIRSDNGTPFASYNGLRRLSGLSVWWIKNGIHPNRIPPASPQFNGGHERLHLDIKKELQQTPAKNLKLQQTIFDGWQECFNTVRPHHHLQKRTPAEVYYPSARLYLPKTVHYEYPENFMSRKITSRGKIWWQGGEYFVSNALIREYVGIEREDDLTIGLWFCDYFLGRTDAAFEHPLGGARC